MTNPKTSMESRFEKKTIKRAERFVLGIIAQHGKPKPGKIELIMLKEDIKRFVAGVFVEVDRARDKEWRKLLTKQTGGNIIKV